MRHVLLALVCNLVACSAVAHASECSSLQSAEWLLGHWISRDGERTSRESWTRLNDTTFEGQGVTTHGNDPTPVDGESLRLVQMGNGVFYVAKVGHNRFPVAFELTQCSAEHLVFENPSHDFPRRLEYRRQAADAMTVHVSDGKEKGFTLSFRRTTGP